MALSADGLAADGMLGDLSHNQSESLQQSVFITPELSGNAGFIAMIQPLCSFLCICSILSLSTAISQNQSSVPLIDFYLHLSLFSEFLVHIPTPTASFSPGDGTQRQHDGFHPHSLASVY